MTKRPIFWPYTNQCDQKRNSAADTVKKVTRIHSRGTCILLKFDLAFEINNQNNLFFSHYFSAVMVERSDVVITDTRDTDEGNLRVSFYVKQGSKVLRGDALANAVQVLVV